MINSVVDNVYEFEKIDVFRFEKTLYLLQNFLRVFKIDLTFTWWPKLLPFVIIEPRRSMCFLYSDY